MARFLVAVAVLWLGVAGSALSQTPTMDSNRHPPLDMGTWRVWSVSNEYRVRLNNRDTGDIAIQNVRIANSEGDNFWYKRGCTPPWTLRRNGYCDVFLLFHPLAVGRRSGTLEVTYRETAGTTATYSLPLVGVGRASDVVVDPTSSDFGAQPLGVASQPTVFTLRNHTSAQQLSVRSVALTSDDRSAFAVENRCNQPVPPSQSCQVAVTFQPERAGPYYAALTVGHSVHREDIVLLLSGRGDPSLSPLSLSPETLDFGVRRIGDPPSDARPIEVTNNAATGIEITEVEYDDERSQFEFPVDNFCTASGLEGGPPLLLAPRESCRLFASFLPRAEGQRTARILVRHSGPGAPAAAALKGTGESAPAIEYAAQPHPSGGHTCDPCDIVPPPPW